MNKNGDKRNGDTPIRYYLYQNASWTPDTDFMCEIEEITYEEAVKLMGGRR